MTDTICLWNWDVEAITVAENHLIIQYILDCKNVKIETKFSFFDKKIFFFILPLSKKRSLSCYQHPFRSCVLRRQRCIQYEVQCFPLDSKCRPRWNLFFGADQSGTRLGSLFWCNFGDNNSIKFLVLDDIIYRSIFVKTAGILRIHKLMFLFCFHVAPPAGAVLTFGGINNFHDIMTNAVK